MKWDIQSAVLSAAVRRPLNGLKNSLEQKVQERTRRLEEMNTALKVVLEYREEEKKEIIQNFTKDLKNLVSPHLDTLRMKCATPELLAILDVVETNLAQITQPFNRLMSDDLELTPMESRVADLIRQGRTTKEIAQLLGITPRGVTFHRTNIRIKAGIHKQSSSLKSILEAV